MKTNARKVSKQVAGQARKPVIRTPQKRAALRDMLGLDLDPKPHGAWEGRFVGSSGSAMDREVFIAVEMRFVGEVIEGHGRAPNFPKPQPGAPIAVEGLIDHERIEMSLWFDTPLLARIPFVCTGQVDEEQRTIWGSWTCGCFQPEKCACGGARGTFELKRIG